MPEYKFEARDGRNKKITGTMHATNIMELEAKLLQRQLYLFDCEEYAPKGEGRGVFSLFRGRVPIKEKANFLKMLKVFIEAGIPLNGALEEAQEGVKNKNLKSVIMGVRNAVEQNGETLAGALSLYPHVFDAMVVESVRMGEESGNLPQILTGQAERLSKEAAIHGKIKVQSISPAITLLAVIGLLVLLNVSVIPKLMSAYNDFLPSGKLPPKTAVIMAINGFLMDYGLIFPLLLALLIVGWFWAEKYPSAKKAKDRLKFRIPVLREFILYADLARVSEGMQIGGNSGLPIIQVFQFLEKHVSSSVIAERLKNIRSEVNNGQTLNEAARMNPLDHVFTAMVRTGEKTGDIPYTMGIAAEHYAEKIDNMISVLSIVAGFVVLILMAIIVGFAMLSAMVPMYELPTVLV